MHKIIYRKQYLNTVFYRHINKSRQIRNIRKQAKKMSEVPQTVNADFLYNEKKAKLLDYD